MGHPDLFIRVASWSTFYRVTFHQWSYSNPTLDKDIDYLMQTSYSCPKTVWNCQLEPWIDIIRHALLSIHVFDLQTSSPLLTQNTHNNWPRTWDKLSRAISSCFPLKSLMVVLANFELAAQPAIFVVFFFDFTLGLSLIYTYSGTTWLTSA